MKGNQSTSCNQWSNNQMHPMANSCKRLLDMKYLRVFLIRLGLMLVDVLHTFV